MTKQKEACYKCKFAGHVFYNRKHVWECRFGKSHPSVIPMDFHCESFSERKPTKKQFVYKYNLINDKGKFEPWTGVFPNKQASEDWYAQYGKKFEDEGKRLYPYFKEIKKAKK